MNNEAFAQLVDAHYAPLYRFALSLARNGSDAGDLVQQTFFIWATKGHGLRELSKAKSWLFTTLYREFLRGRLEALARPAPPAAAFSWLLIHSWKRAGGITWTVERISECPTPQSRLHTTG